MEDPRETLFINARVQISTNALEAIVEHAKKQPKTEDDVSFRGDTADWVGEMISRFLFEKDFDSYVEDSDNYPR
jgi:hypothetical protein